MASNYAYVMCTYTQAILSPVILLISQQWNSTCKYYPLDYTHNRRVFCRPLTQRIPPYTICVLVPSLGVHYQLYRHDNSNSNRCARSCSLVWYQLLQSFWRHLATTSSRFSMISWHFVSSAITHYLIRPGSCFRLANYTLCIIRASSQRC